MKLVIRGFTLVELVTVLVLVGIAGAMIVSRFLSPNAFNALATRDALVTALRSAQQAALGRSNVRFRIEDGGDEFIFTVLAAPADTEIRRLEIPAGDVTLETGPTTWSGTDTCATVAAYADPLVGFELSFDSKGNLALLTNDSTPVAVDENFNGVRLCINDTVDMSVCVSPAGYAHVGNCNE